MTKSKAFFLVLLTFTLGALVGWFAHSRTADPSGHSDDGQDAETNPVHRELLAEIERLHTQLGQQPETNLANSKANIERWFVEENGNALCSEFERLARGSAAHYPEALDILIRLQQFHFSYDRSRLGSFLTREPAPFGIWAVQQYKVASPWLRLEVLNYLMPASGKTIPESTFISLLSAEPDALVASHIVWGISSRIENLDLMVAALDRFGADRRAVENILWKISQAPEDEAARRLNALAGNSHPLVKSEARFRLIKMSSPATGLLVHSIPSEVRTNSPSRLEPGDILLSLNELVVPDTEQLWQEQLAKIGDKLTRIRFWREGETIESWESRDLLLGLSVDPIHKK